MLKVVIDFTASERFTSAVNFWLLWPLDSLSLRQLVVPNPIAGYHLAVVFLKYSSQSSG